MRIGVIILNYLAYKATIDCVYSFLKQVEESEQLFEIIVVDNASTNDSFIRLKESLEKYNNVHLFQTKSNLGFAGGNNYGYEKLLEYGEFDYVIVSNDDILLEQNGLVKWIKASEEQYNFAVLGPSIYSVSGEYHQSPLANFTQDINEAYAVLRKYRSILYKLKIKKLIVGSKRNPQAFEKWENDLYNTTQLDKTLHGSFLIFSKRYFEKYELPFDSRTFLYMEEYLLKLRCDKKGLNMVYSPEYQVKHLQAQSSVMSDKSLITKQIARQKQLIKSLQIYIQELKEMIND